MSAPLTLAEMMRAPLFLAEASLGREQLHG